MRAAAGLILTMGLISLTGVFSKQVTFTAALVLPLAFLSLGIGRIVSIIGDGMPVDAMVKATGFEFILGIAGLIIFLIYRNKQ